MMGSDLTCGIPLGQLALGDDVTLDWAIRGRGAGGEGAAGYCGSDAVCNIARLTTSRLVVVRVIPRAMAFHTDAIEAKAQRFAPPGTPN